MHKNNNLQKLTLIQKEKLHQGLLNIKKKNRKLKLPSKRCQEKVKGQTCMLKFQTSRRKNLERLRKKGLCLPNPAKAG
jgi:hypothetical protein